MPATVALHTLGECRITVTRDGRVETLTPSRDRLFTLALLLAADPGRPLPRARAATWLWPDLEPAAARHALRQLAYRLRRLGVPLDGDDESLAMAARHVAPADAPGPLGTPASDTDPLGAPPRPGRCLPGWDPPGRALAEWADDYRAEVEAAARDRFARALQAAPPGEARARLAAALLELDPHHPLARAALPARVRETPRRPDTLPLVGRDGVMAAFREYAADARAGRARAVVLTASPGAGATRLLGELAATARAAGLATLSTPSPHPRTFPDALAATVEALLDRPGSLGCAPHTARTLRRFVATPLLPAGTAPLRRLGAAVAELARAVAAERPLLFAVDAPCTTPADRALAAAVARDLAGSAALAVFVAPAHAGASAPVFDAAFHVVPVRPLELPDAAQLVTTAARASGRTIGRDDVAWCVATAGGRPADLIALADACAHHPGTRDLPPAIAARVRGALAALPQRTRDVATLHAQLGDRASPTALARAFGRHRIAIDAALRALERAGLPPLPPPNARPAYRRTAIRAFNTAATAALA